MEWVSAIMHLDQKAGKDRRQGRQHSRFRFLSCDEMEADRRRRGLLNGKLGEVRHSATEWLRAFTWDQTPNS